MSNAPFGKVNSKNGDFRELKEGRILVNELEAARLRP